MSDIVAHIRVSGKDCVENSPRLRKQHIHKTIPKTQPSMVQPSLTVSDRNSFQAYLAYSMATINQLRTTKKEQIQLQSAYKEHTLWCHFFFGSVMLQIPSLCEPMAFIPPLRFSVLCVLPRNCLITTSTDVTQGDTM